jgi:PAS domain S-box-containing protein
VAEKDKAAAGGASATDDSARETEERYRTLFEQAPVGVFVYDRSFRMRNFNARLVEILRTKREALENLDLRSLRDQRILPTLERPFAGSVARYEGAYESTTSGANLTISMQVAPLRDATGEVVYAMGVVEDVTTVRASEDALRASVERFRRLVELLPDGVVVYSVAGRILYVNPAMRRSLRYADDEELGKEIFGYIHPDDRARSAERRDVMLRGGSTPPAEIRIQRSDGTWATMEAASLEVDFDGERAVLTVLRELSERGVVQARLAQADRMIAVGTLAAGVAHEINNPLAYLKANLDVALSRRIPQLAADLAALAAEGSSAETQRAAAASAERGLGQLREMLELALDGAERVRTIVQDLRTFSREEEPLFPIDPRRVLDASLNLAGPDIRPRARVEKRYGDVPAVRGSEARLGQVFLNLLVNAAHAIPAGDPQHHRIVVATFTDPEGRACVSVSDTGMGMPTEVLTRIWDPFFTTKTSGEGTGLGLWVCQRIVSKLGGAIEVASQPGEGTTFIVRLPAGDKPTPTSPPESA